MKNCLTAINIIVALLTPSLSNDVLTYAQTLNSENAENDLCQPYNPSVPDFSASGRRISIQKCYEYLWQIKVRIERAHRTRRCNSNNSTKKIIGGRAARIIDYSNMGAIGWRSADDSEVWKFKCGCTLISPKFVITAAHCAKASSRDTSIVDVVPKIVRFGKEDIIKLDLFRQAVDRNISRIIVHPKYSSPKKYYDIALMELDEEVPFTKYVQPSCLWNGPVDSFKALTVTGWGVTTPEAHEGHPFLQMAMLDIVDSETCNKLLKPMCNRLWCGIEDHQFCAGQMAGGVDACQGDSGGPLQSRIPLPTSEEGNMHYIIGVTSFGFGCGRKEVPGVYTKVPAFLDWIEKIVWG